MNQRLKQRRDRIDAMAEELSRESKDGTVFVTSLDLPERGIKAGETFVVSPRLAGVGIVDRTHELASKKDIMAYHARERELNADNQRAMAARQKPQNVVLSAEAVTALRAGVKPEAKPEAAAS